MRKIVLEFVMTNSNFKAIVGIYTGTSYRNNKAIASPNRNASCYFMYHQFRLPTNNKTDLRKNTWCSGVGRG